MLANVPIDGLLLFLYLASPVLALIAAFVIRWRYRVSVSRLMMAKGGSGQPAGAPDLKVAGAGTSATASEPLAIETETLRGTAVPAQPLVMLGIAYFIAGLAHGIGSTIVLFVLSGIEFLPVRTTIVCMVFSTPAVFSALFAMGVRFHLIVIAAAAWLALAIAIAAPFGGGFAVVWQLSWFVALPLLTTVLVINRTVGTVAPFLLVPAMLIVIGLLSTLDAALFALESYQSVFAAYAAASLPVIAGVLAALLYLALIAWQYSRGRASELTLQSDMLWLLVSTFHAMPLTRYAGWYALAMFIPFVAYRVTLWLAGFALHSRLEPARLLFLRVFGFRKRQAELHRLFLNAWRGRGPVAFIGSADLALETMDPPELFAFITGRLKRLFVNDPAAVESGLAKPPGQTVDGLYAVDDFYCFDDTWQPTVQTLIEASAAVLMDLRGFGPDNMGCVFEIEELLKRADLERLIFLVDDSTDEPFLERCMAQAWANVPATARSRSDRTAATVRLWRLESGSALKGLHRQIPKSARPGGAP